MQGSPNLFSSGAALEALCWWSDSFKSFQQRWGKYYARSEARLAAFDYIQALLCPLERKNGSADGRTGRIRQSVTLTIVLQKYEQQVVEWETVSVCSHLHVQIQPLQMAALWTRNDFVMRALVSHLPVVLPTSGRNGKWARLGCAPYNDTPMGTAICTRIRKALPIPHEFD